MRRAVIAVVVLAAIGASDRRGLNGQSSPAYTVVDLSATLGGNATVNDLNAFGGIAGAYRAPHCCPSSTIFTPFVFENGSVQSLSFSGTVGGLNDRGELAGTNNTTSQAFRYQNGTATDLGT